MGEKIKIDTKLLQKDFRIRLPKMISQNLDVNVGKTFFDVYFDYSTKEIVLKVCDTVRKEDAK